MSNPTHVLILVGEGKIETVFTASEAEAERALISDLFENYQEYSDIPTDYEDAAEWVSEQDIDLIWTIHKIPAESEVL